MNRGLATARKPLATPDGCPPGRVEFHAPQQITPVSLDHPLPSVSGWKHPTPLQIEERPPPNTNPERVSRWDRLFAFIEGPWGPDPADLPAKRHPSMSGNSEAGFYKRPASTASFAMRQRLLSSITNTESRVSLSGWTTLYRFDVPLPAQHRGLDNMRILHLSDVHLLQEDLTSTRELGVISSFLEDSGLRPDIVMFTGDLITRSPRDLNDVALGHLQKISRLSQYSFWVPGNHDFHGHRPDQISSWMQDAGFHDLTNKHADLTRGGARFSMIGIDDANFGAPVAPPIIDPERLNMVMTHDLDAIRDNFPTEVFAFFSGHTHGGETWLPGFSNLMKAWGYLEGVNRTVRDWSVLNDTGSLSYVHRGQMRYYCRNSLLWLPPGITLHTLRAVD